MDRREFFLHLVRLGIGHESPEGLIVPEDMSWKRVKAIADEQELLAVAFDGVEKLRETHTEFLPEKKLLTRWGVEVLRRFEDRFEQYQHTIGEVAAFYNRHKIKMMILKGYACSINWPKPEHRPMGDIDVWFFGRSKEADKLLERREGIKVDNSQHHHTVFFWKDIMVENHYDMFNVHIHKSNVEMEKVLKPLAEDDSYSMEIDGQKVYLPSPNLHALFLLRHACFHFVSTGLTFRILLDWAFYVKAHRDEVDWEWLESVIDRFRMRDFYEVINALCVEDLGFDSSVFPKYHCSAEVKQRVLDDIFVSGRPEKLPRNFFARALFRLRRWKANGWKRKLCFHESMWDSFWCGVVSHLIKPTTI